MKTLNKVMIIGVVKVKQQPIVLSDGKELYPFVVTTDYSYKNKAGEQKYFEEDNYIVFWNNLGNVTHQKINVGDTVFIEGRLQTRFWHDEENEVRHEVNVLGERFIVLKQATPKIYK